MIFKVLYFLCVAAEFAAVPVFLKHYWPQRCKKSFMWKTVASSLFVLAGFFAMKASGNSTPYADMIIWGLVFGMLGDLLLHALSQKMVLLVAGVIAFLTGHIFYIVGIHQAIKTTYPDAAAFAWYELLAIAVVVVLVLCIMIFAKLIKTDQPLILVGLSGYLVFLTTMLVKAFSFVIGEWAYGTNDNVLMLILTVALGALLFFISDLTMGLMMLNKERFETKMMRYFNIGTYYAAQILLGSSIFFVQSFEIFGK